jgi:hypothetical protein
MSRSKVYANNCKLADKALASVLNQVADHESNAVGYYLNEIVNFNTQAAAMDRPSDETVHK